MHSGYYYDYNKDHQRQQSQVPPHPIHPSNTPYPPVPSHSQHHHHHQQQQHPSQHRLSYPHPSTAPYPPVPGPSTGLSPTNPAAPSAHPGASPSSAHPSHSHHHHHSHHHNNGPTPHMPGIGSPNGHPGPVHSFDFADVPSWPPPYPINTAISPFSDQQPHLSERNYLTQLPPESELPVLKSKSAADGNPHSPLPQPQKRQRISRACDKCNQLRTKCDGKDPCAHCVEFQQVCTYERVQRKRGKVPKAQQAAMAREKQAREDHDKREARRKSSQALGSETSAMGRLSMDSSNMSVTDGDGMASSHDAAAAMTGIETIPQTNGNQQYLGHDGTTGMSYPDYGVTPAESTPYPGSINSISLGSASSAAPQQAWRNGGPVDEYPTRWSPSYSSPASINNASRLFNFALDDFAAGQTPTNDSLNSMNFEAPANMHDGRENEKVRYPILEPLLPHISSFIPAWLACALLESYFASSPNAIHHPASPYLFTFLYNKRTFLSEEVPLQPRRPALLASMLWIAARTSESAYLTSDPHTRSRICKRLLEITIKLLNPLIHQLGVSANPILGAYQLAEGRSIEDRLEEIQAAGTGFRSGAVDDIGCYIHIATVVSASENKRASIRWWNAAWGFAREVQLGLELPRNNSREPSTQIGADTMDIGVSPKTSESGVQISEEEREERRRTWWLLYMMDRHLALCYNRPLFLHNRECADLFHPMDEDAWQNGDFTDADSRGKGPPVLFAGTSMFGFYLPLMTITGEAVDLHDLRNDPRLGLLPEENATIYERRARAIKSQLLLYQQSLEAFRQAHENDRTPSSPYTAATHEAEIAVAYGTYVSHVLHILITGRWDPIELLDDKDEWLSSAEAKVASEHAVKAANAISEVLEIDQDLSHLPYFLGIQLLQGSFLLLVLADRHQTKASVEVIKACEDMCRAHEACVVTLDTEYQRNFRRIMRGALAEVRGRVTQDTKLAQHRRRREILSLYRWTNDGCGIAL